MNILLVYMSLPRTVHALAHENNDGTYTVLINRNDPSEKQINSVLHELEHIKGNDFTREENATVIEKLIHGKTLSADTSGFHFFVA